jgi:hypothetical protein
MITNIITQSLINMKNNFIKTLLIALVVVNVLDGDFVNPSILDYIKFFIIGIALILSIINDRR